MIPYSSPKYILCINPYHFGKNDTIFFANSIHFCFPGECGILICPYCVYFKMNIRPFWYLSFRHFQFLIPGNSPFFHIPKVDTIFFAIFVSSKTSPIIFSEKYAVSCGRFLWKWYLFFRHFPFFLTFYPLINYSKVIWYLFFRHLCLKIFFIIFTKLIFKRSTMEMIPFSSPVLTASISFINLPFF